MPIRFAFLFLLAAAPALANPSESSAYEEEALTPSETLPARARAKQTNSEKQELTDERPARVRRPGYLGFSFGNPTPSLLGVVGAYQFNSALQAMISGGKLIWGDISTTSFALTARLHILPWAFTPFVGGGATLIFVNGSESLQGLNYSTSLPFLDVGADLMLGGLRLAAGLNFHFPIQIIFPFVDVGYAF